MGKDQEGEYHHSNADAQTRIMAIPLVYKARMIVWARVKAVCCLTGTGVVRKLRGAEALQMRRLSGIISTYQLTHTYSGVAPNY